MGKTTAPVGLFLRNNDPFWRKISVLLANVKIKMFKLKFFVAVFVDIFSLYNKKIFPSKLQTRLKMVPYCFGRASTYCIGICWARNQNVHYMTTIGKLFVSLSLVFCAAKYSKTPHILT